MAANTNVHSSDTSSPENLSEGVATTAPRFLTNSQRIYDDYMQLILETEADE